MNTRREHATASPTQRSQRGCDGQRLQRRLACKNSQMKLMFFRWCCHLWNRVTP